jgi:monofunctional glycosyltransferase
VKFRASLAQWVLRITLLVLLAVVAIQLWYAGWIAWWRWNDPVETAFMRRELAALQARNPRAELKHRWVTYERIATSLKRAVITAEDARFAEHEGVDWEAIEKAYKDNVKRGRPARGGSTITQQLAKNLFLSAERSYVRKAQELVITYMIEAFWDKRRILEVYLRDRGAIERRAGRPAGGISAQSETLRSCPVRPVSR